MSKEHPNQNKEFEFQGLHHLALVANDMEETVDFYQNKLGMPLIKSIDLPCGVGQHFFFDMGNGDTLAFFSLTDGPPTAPGIASQDKGLTSAVASMHHVALPVPADKIVSGIMAGEGPQAVAAAGQQAEREEDGERAEQEPRGRPGTRGLREAARGAAGIAALSVLRTLATEETWKGVVH